jgi:hypothetical protein
MVLKLVWLRVTEMLERKKKLGLARELAELARVLVTGLSCVIGRFHILL